MSLTPRYGKDLKIVADLSSSTASIIKKTRQMEGLEKLSFITINEKR